MNFNQTDLKLTENEETAMKGKCSKCDFRSDEAQDMRDHTNIEHNGFIFTCSLCDDKFKLRRDFEGHKRKVHKGLIAFIQVKKAAQIRSRIEVNYFKKKSDDEEKTIFQRKPQKSGKRYLRILSKNQSECESATEDESKDQIYECKHCDLTTKYKTRLNNHVMFQHEGVIAKCSHCDGTFTSRDGFYTHRKSRHMGENASYTLETRLNNNHDESPSVYLEEKEDQSANEGMDESESGGQIYKCELCPFTSKYKSSKRNHVMFQHEGVIAKCSHCDGTFASKTSFSIHRKSSHKGENASYALETRINNNNDESGRVLQEETEDQSANEDVDESESGGRIYKCELCSFTSKRKRDKKDHVIFQHEGKIIKCSHCEGVFTSRDEFSTHKKSNHKGEKVTCTVENRTEEDQKDIIQSVSHEDNVTVDENNQSLQGAPVNPQPQGAPQSLEDRNHMQNVSHEDNLLQDVHKNQSLQGVHIVPELQGASIDDNENILSTSKASENVEEIDYKNVEAGNHFLGKLFSCSLCEYTAKVRNKVESHFRAKHEGFVWICQLCSKPFPTKDAYYVHKVKEHRGIPTKFRFGRLKSETEGEKSHPGRNWSSNLIKESSQSGSQSVGNVDDTVSLPAARYEFGLYHCPICRIYAKKGKLFVDDHIRFKHYGYKAVCVNCGQEFNSRSRFNAHKQKVHHGSVSTCV